jgi:5-methyltetrahydrofolate--homocysteine methyltransferase
MVENLTLSLNCCEGTEGLREPAALLNASHGTIGISPSAGRPSWDSGRQQYVYGDTPETWARTFLNEIEHLEVDQLGGCCGTTPAHVEELARSGMYLDGAQ